MRDGARLSCDGSSVQDVFSQSLLTSLLQVSLDDNDTEGDGAGLAWSESAREIPLDGS